MTTIETMTTTETQCSILKQYVRYSQINEVLKDTCLWYHITEEMLNRYSNTELKKKGSGQTSISNMIERKTIETFPEIYSVDCINQSVTGKTTDRPLYVVPNEIKTKVVSYIQSLKF